MKYRLIFITLILTVTFALSACQKSATENNQLSSHPLPTISPTPNLITIPTPNLNSPIRKVDFKNFTFPETDGYPKFKLKNGEKLFSLERNEDGIDLFKIDYSDLTNDGNEEAILEMSIETGGSSMPNFIYIYTLKNDEPKIMWSFMTGDRAVGGLKELYVENGELIVELFGDSKIVDDKWLFSVPKDKYLGDGRPSIFTKNRLKWNGKKFAVQGKPELFDYDINLEAEKNQP